jgi:hypothetical protein
MEQWMDVWFMLVQDFTVFGGALSELMRKIWGIMEMAKGTVCR